MHSTSTSTRSHRSSRASSSGVDALLRTARRAPILTAAEELELSRRAHEHDADAFAQLLGSHLRLVLAIARDYRVYGLPFDELVSEGLLGLCEAARRFQPERGARLSAYAAFWIRAYMRRYTIGHRRIVRTPSSRHGRKLLSRLRKTQHELAHARGEAPSADEVAQALGVELRDVEEMEAALCGRDVPWGMDDGWEAAALAESQSPELLAAGREERDRSHDAVVRGLQVLSERERRILEQRYFVEDAQSFAAIGRSLGLSRERVRQLERRAQSKMRAAIAQA